MITPSVFNALYKITQLLHVNAVGLYGGAEIEFWCKSGGLHGCTVPSEDMGLYNKRCFSNKSASASHSLAFRK